jgi:hypothetical protein
MSLKFSVGAVLFCDDVRMERNGKAILIGVYSGTIDPSQIPATMQFVYWLIGTAEGEGEFSLQLKVEFVLEDGAVSQRADSPVLSGTVTNPLNEAKQHFQVAVPGAPMHITGPGQLVVSAKYTGVEDFTEIGRKHVVAPKATSKLVE